MQPPPSPTQRPALDLRRLHQAAEGAGIQLPETAVLALQQGQLLEAIKRIRAANPGLDLRRAKQLADRLQAHSNATKPAKKSTHKPDTASGHAVVDAAHAVQSRDPHARPPTVQMGDAPGGLRWVLAVAVLLAVAVWLAFGV